jgi:hypothetical protein
VAPWSDGATTAVSWNGAVTEKLADAAGVGVTPNSSDAVKSGEGRKLAVAETQADSGTAPVGATGALASSPSDFPIETVGATFAEAALARDASTTKVAKPESVGKNRPDGKIGELAGRDEDHAGAPEAVGLAVARRESESATAADAAPAVPRAGTVPGKSAVVERTVELVRMGLPHGFW